MSKVQLEEFPNWEFDVDETSANIYRVMAKHRLGPTIERSGYDPDGLLEQVKADAKQMEKTIEEKMK